MISRLALFTAASGLLLGLSPYLAPTLTPLCLIITGFLVTLLVVKRIPADAVLSWIIGTSYVLKVALALAFFYISQWGLPVLETIQLGNGFWAFGRDSANYHSFGQRIVEAWRLGISLPEMGAERGMNLYFAAVYFLFGSHPLHPALLNAWYGTLSVVFAVLLVRRFTDHPWAARIAALLIAFWPSLILWSTQLLKDPFILFLLLAELYLIVTLWEPPQESPIRGACRWAAAAFIPFLVQFVRDYLGIIFATSAILAFYPVVMLRAWRGEFRSAGRAVAISLVIIVATFLATRIDLVLLASPDQPERGHLRLGLQYHEKGEREQAVTQYREALQQNSKYAPAYRNLGIALLQQGALKEAARTFERYLALEPLQNERPAVVAELATLYRMLGAQRRAAQPAQAPGMSFPALIPLDDPSPKSTIRMMKAKATQILSAFKTGVTRHRGGMMGRATPEHLGKVRQGIIGEGGGSVVDPEVKIKNALEMLQYLPRGLTVIFFAPFPWQWFYTKGDAGPLRLLAGLETLMIYLLFPSVILCARSLWRRGDPKGWFLLAFIGLLAVAFAVAIPNVGTLFRLRLQFIIPLVILLASTRSLSGVYGRIFERSRLALTCRRIPFPSG